MTILSNKYLELLPDFREARTQKFTSIVLTLIALSFFSLLAINPTLATIARLKKEISDSEVVNQKLQQKITNLSMLQQEYSHLENDVPIVFDSIPKSPSVPLLTAQTQSVAQSSNINVSQLQNSTVELFKQNRNKKYYSYSFTIAGVGVYEDISKFMESIINMQRIINIDMFSINKTKDQDKSLQLNFQGVAYYKE